MPCIRGEHYGRSALVQVAIIDAARHKAHRESGAPVLSGVRPFLALFDTGASSTMISSRVATELGLQPVGRRRYAALGGPVNRDTYLFHVAFYSGKAPRLVNQDHDLPRSIEISRIHVCSRIINGGEIDDGQSFEVLLGMDVITSGTLVIDKDGSFSFTY
jgi:hypothetical protein